jgi:hypothetical protein
MAQGGDTAAPSPDGPRGKAKHRRWLLLGTAGGGIILAGVVVVLFVFLGNPAGTKAPGKEETRPVDAVPSAKKTPAKVDEAWFKQVAALPAAKQVEAVAGKLKELNPGFDGKVTHQVENGVVTSLQVPADNVTDIAPVRALTALQRLDCSSPSGKGQLADLSPLKGMKLTSLDCSGTKVSDLSPLKGMPLTILYCYSTQVSDLSPLKGMPLTQLHLRGMPLTKVSDLSLLKGMPLKVLWCDFKPERDTEILRSIKTLEVINDKPAKDFWQEVDVKKTDKKP